jgi:hypothetical protein
MSPARHLPPLVLLPILAAFLGSAGCQEYSLGMKLNAAGRTLDEYGTVTMSAPFFVKADETFNYNPTSATAENFYGEAKTRIQGASAQSTERALGSALQLHAQADLNATAQYLGQLSQYGQTQALQNMATTLRLQAAQTTYNAAMANAEKADDVAKAKAQAYTDYANAISAMATAPTPTAPTINVSTTSSGMSQTSVSSLLTGAASSLNSANAMSLGSLITSAGTPAISNRAALIISAGDTATKGIFTVLGDPTRSAQFAGKKVLMAVTMVSVNPGWRTRTGYSADVMVNIDFDFVPARPEVVEGLDPADLGIPIENATDAQQTKKDLVDTAIAISLAPWEKDRSKSSDKACVDSTVIALLATAEEKERMKEIRSLDTNKMVARAQAAAKVVETADRNKKLKELAATMTRPLVAAVAPMNDAHVLDLQNSQRDQTAQAMELALALTYAGFGAQAETILQYAERHQSDTRTRTPNVVANAYSIAGGHFGFEIGPSTVAIENPGEYSKASSVLSRQAFPALLIIGLENADLRPRLLEDKQAGLRVVMEPRLKISQTSCWHPLGWPNWRLSDVDRLSLIRQIAEVEDEIDDMRANRFGANISLSPRGVQEITDFAEARVQTLSAKIAGDVTHQYLPPSFVKAMHYNEPFIKNVDPTEVPYDPAADSSKNVAHVYVLGEHLDHVNIKGIKVVGGKTQVADASAIGSGTILVNLKVADDAPFILELPSLTPGYPAQATHPIKVKVNKPAEKPGPLYIERKIFAGTDRIEFSKDVPADVIKSEIEKSKPQPAPAPTHTDKK